VATVADGPTIVCLCGSTKFKDAFTQANREETLAGKIVLSVGFFAHSGDGPLSDTEKAALDDLHLRKIDLASEALFLNVGGYIGSSTHRELAYAIFTNKKVRFLEPVLGEQYMENESHKLAMQVAKFAMQERDER
jgi:hypothetical protein